MTKGERIKSLRESAGISQTDLADKIDVSKQSLYKYENDIITNIPSDKIEAISSFFNVSPAYLMGWDVNKEDFAKSEKAAALPLRIPVLGRVAAGVPINMVEDVVDWEELPADMARHGEYFGLVIHGDSMEPKMSEGDVIIVRQQADIESGQIGIITVNGDDATCKRIMKYADGIMLLSTNPKYPPMQYTSKEMKDLPIRILGKVVELRAKFE